MGVVILFSWKVLISLKARACVQLRFAAGQALEVKGEHQHAYAADDPADQYGAGIGAFRDVLQQREDAAPIMAPTTGAARPSCWLGDVDISQPPDHWGQNSFEPGWKLAADINQ
ncbi:hypothetical protein [Pseudomonas nicosulfuronedens]